MASHIRTWIVFGLLLFGLVGAGCEPVPLPKVERSVERVVDDGLWGFSTPSSGGAFPKIEAMYRKIRVVMLGFILVACVVVFVIGTNGRARHHALMMEAASPGGCSGLPPPDTLKKNMMLGYILWFGFGWVGAHRAYLMRPLSAVLMCLVSAVGFLGPLLAITSAGPIDWVFSWIEYSAVWLFATAAWGVWILCDAFLLHGWILTQNHEIDILFEEDNPVPAAVLRALSRPPETGSAPARASNPTASSGAAKESSPEVARLEARIQELEAELLRKNAALAELATRQALDD